MSLFDSVISEAGERFGLGDKAGTLLSALLSLMTDQNRGGFAGFLDRFSQVGLGDTVETWIGSGVNSDLSDEQVESALGEETIKELGDQADVEASTAKSALAYMIPSVVDKITPDGVIPEDRDLLSRIGDFLSGGVGATAGAVIGAAGVAGATMSDMASGLDTERAVVSKSVEIPDRNAETISDTAGANVGAGTAALESVDDRVSGVSNSVGDTLVGDDDNGGILNWLLPLILLGLLLLLGFWFCGKGTPPTPAGNVNANVNANKGNSAANSNAAVVVNNNAANSTTADAPRTLTEVSLPDGTKLKAYPGGIEDQLIKFIKSDEYKNGNEESLKNKWFNFDDLNFKFNSPELESSSQRQLDNIVAILKAFPDAKIKIGAYSDKKGDDAANLKLSDSRAKSVKAALDKSGVGAQVPQTEGYGEKFATVAETESDEARKIDRKTAVRLIKGDAAAKTVETNTNAAKPAANTNK